MHDRATQDAVYAAFEDAESASEELVTILGGLADEMRRYEKPASRTTEVELLLVS